MTSSRYCRRWNGRSDSLSDPQPEGLQDNSRWSKRRRRPPECQIKNHRHPDRVRDILISFSHRFRVRMPLLRGSGDLRYATTTGYSLATLRVATKLGWRVNYAPHLVIFSSHSNQLTL